MAMVAYFSGLSAAQGTPVFPEESAAVTTHFTWADRTTWFFVFFASLLIAFSYIWRPAARWAAVAAFVVALVGVGSLLVTADHGGRLVFQHGLSPQYRRSADSCGPCRTTCLSRDRDRGTEAGHVSGCRRHHHQP